MRVLVACEESQVVCIEFRKRGHEAYSCDLQECSGGHPEWHKQGDVFEIINDGWDLLIAHPPCTYLTVSGNKWLKEQPPRKSGVPVGRERYIARNKGMDFFLRFVFCKIPKWCIENPVGVMSTWYRKPDQVIQPWMFGHGETKATCLWLNNLPKLVWNKEDNLFGPKTAAEGREQVLHKLHPSAERSKLRSKTFPNIARAMAEQWG